MQACIVLSCAEHLKCYTIRSNFKQSKNIHS